MDSAEKNEKKELAGKGWTTLLAAVCFATTVGVVLPVGYCLGSLNTPAELIKSWCYNTLAYRYGWQLTESQMELLWASVVSTFIVGGICGSFAGAGLCDKFGRKGCLLITAFILMISGLLFNFCREVNSVEMLFLGRFLAGFAAALVYTAHPMYLLEIAPAELRSSVGVYTAIGVVIGICVGQVFTLKQLLGTETHWQYALSFYVLFVAICCLPSYWFPESPRWLYMVKQDVKAARFELERLRGSNAEEYICMEMADMEQSTSNNAEKVSFLSVLKNPEYLLPLVLVCSYQACQQLSGINAIFYYSVPIFTKAGFSLENAAWLNLGAGALNIVTSVIGPPLMARFNRRPLMMLSSICCFVSHIGLAFALYYMDFADWLPTACMVLMSSFITFFNLGMGPIPYFIGSELFEISPRPVAMSLGCLASWIGNFMIGMFFPLLQGAVGSFAFLPCALVCLYSFLLTWRYLPETRSRDPVDLKALCKDGFRSKVK